MPNTAPVRPGVAMKANPPRKGGRLPRKLAQFQKRMLELAEQWTPANEKALKHATTRKHALA